MYLVLVLIGAAALEVAAAYECDVKVDAVGCFKDKVGDRALPIEILNERADPSNKVSSKFVIQWNDPSYFPKFLCRCSLAAKSRGFEYFGIQFHGECWSGPGANLTYDKHGKADASSCKNWKGEKKCGTLTGKKNTNAVYRILDLDQQCSGVSYYPLGCFHDDQIKPRPLPNYILSERDTTSDVYNDRLIEWKNWNSYLPQWICRCAAEAKKKGADYFGIQYFGECWAGKEGESDFKRNAVSGKCVGLNYNPCRCNDYHCAGKRYTNFVYALNDQPSCNNAKGTNDDDKNRVQLDNFFDRRQPYFKDDYRRNSRYQYGYPEYAKNDYPKLENNQYSNNFEDYDDIDLLF